MADDTLFKRVLNRFAGADGEFSCHALQANIRADSFTISLMPSYVAQRADREPSCRECEILEERLSAVTDSIVKILEKRFIREEEKLQQLDEVLDERQRVLENYLEHLEDHRPAIAA